MWWVWVENLEIWYKALSIFTSGMDAVYYLQFFGYVTDEHNIWSALHALSTQGACLPTQRALSTRILHPGDTLHPGGILLLFQLPWIGLNFSPVLFKL